MTLNVLSTFSGSEFSWLSGPTALQLTRTLFHFAWQGCAVAVLLMVANFALRRKSANVRYIAGVVALTVLALSPPVTFFVLPLTSESRIPVINSSIERGTIETSSSRGSAAMVLEKSEPRLAPAAILPVTNGTREPAANGTEEFTTSTSWLTVASPFVVSAYLTGVIIMLLRLAVGLWAGHQLRLASIETKDESIRRMVARICERWSMHVLPVIAHCQNVTVPVVIGILRPMILLPPALISGLSCDQLEVILLHEIAHIRRWDLVVNIAQRVFESLLFMHPAVWFVSHRISIERENACDDLVLESGCGSLDYVSALLQMADLCISPRGLLVRPASQLAATGNHPSQLKQRILRLLGESATPSPRQVRSGFGVLICVVSLLILTSAIFSWRTQPSRQLPMKLVRPIKEDWPWDVVKNAQNSGGDVIVLHEGLDKHAPRTESHPVTSTIERGEGNANDDVDELIRTRQFITREPTLRRAENVQKVVSHPLVRPVVRRVEYKGLKKVKQKVFDSLTGLNPGSPFDFISNFECARRIEEYYHDKGFAFATVELENGNHLADCAVVFLIHEGPKVKVTAVRFDGKNELIEADVKTRTQTKTVIAWEPEFKYDATTIRNDIEAITLYYRSLGYFDVEIRHEEKFSDDNSKVEVHYLIDEGIRSKIRKIEVTGNLILPDEKIRKTMKVKDGDYYNDRQINRDIEKIKRKYSERIRPLYDVKMAIHRTKVAGIVDISVDINELKPVHFVTAKRSVNKSTTNGTKTRTIDANSLNDERIDFNVNVKTTKTNRNSGRELPAMLFPGEMSPPIHGGAIIRQTNGQVVTFEGKVYRVIYDDNGTQGTIIFEDIPGAK